MRAEIATPRKQADNPAHSDAPPAEAGLISMQPEGASAHPSVPPCLPRLDALAPDLLRATPRQRLICLLRPAVALAGYALMAHRRLWWLIPPVMFGVFITVVSASHDVAHGALGLSRRQTEWALFGLGALLLASGHAYRATHLQHHRMFPDHDDIEGEAIHVSPLRALLMGPLYLPRLWLWAWTRAARRPRERAWLLAEAGLPFLGVAAGVRLWPLAPGVLIYALLVIAGSWTFPLVTAHFQHRVDQPTVLLQSRTLRGRVIPALFLNLTYHLEHHLYPGVPACHIAELARRLDPWLRAAGVEPPQEWPLGGSRPRRKQEYHS